MCARRAGSRRCGGAVARHRGAAACRVAACWVTTGCRGWPRCGAAPPLCSGCARLRRCFRAVLALRSAGWCVAAALGTVACRSFPSLGFVGAPTILSHFSWWRSLFGSASDEAWAGFQGVFRLVAGRFVGPVWRVVHTNPYLPPRTLTNPHTRTPNQEHPFRNTSHTCTSVRCRAGTGGRRKKGLSTRPNWQLAAFCIELYSSRKTASSSQDHYGTGTRHLTLGR